MANMRGSASLFARRNPASGRIVPLAAVLWLSAAGAWAVSDFDWTFNSNDVSSWRLTRVSSPLVYSGAIPAANPTLNLILGKRYLVIDEVFSIHPFQVIAKGATFAQRL